MSILSTVFVVAALLVNLYGANALLLACLYLVHRSPSSQRLPGSQREAPGSTVQTTSTSDWPAVTVQLPIFNEVYVVKRLIDAVARLDYPQTHLQIQVLDDSTDGTCRLARSRVARHRARGLDIEFVHRTDRRGFKSGALRRGLEAARGEFVVLFDADFVPPRDFLKQTIPHLIADPGLGFVQTRWGYLNADYSLLTRAQAVALDGHFVVEHIGRSRSGLLINFNGTAGVWRRQAILDAGGWQDDTLVEDLDLSFRAQLAGWRALYLPEVVAPAELPPQLAAFRHQQARWASGAARCLLKLAGPLLRGRVLPLPEGERVGVRDNLPLAWPARLEGLLHLCLWISHPMTLVLLLLALPLAMGKISLTLNLTALWFVAFGPTIVFALAQHRLYPDWIRRMLIMPVLALLGTGLSLSNTIAIVQVLLHRRQSFRRTPKFRLERKTDRWVGNQYALPFQWITLGELALTGYVLASVGVAIYVGNYFCVPFLLLFAAGFGVMGVHGLRDAQLGRRQVKVSLASPDMTELWLRQPMAKPRGVAPDTERRMAIEDKTT